MDLQTIRNSVYASPPCATVMGRPARSTLLGAVCSEQFEDPATWLEGDEAARRLMLLAAMSRRSTAGSAGIVFHVVTRATCGQLLFRNHGEYLAFHFLLARALAERPIRLLAYCLMPNHQHLVLWPATEGEMTAFLRWLFATHARLLHRCRGTDGRGAIYASRYRAAAIDSETYFYRAMRYVERNPVRARLTDRAEFWPWSSASAVSRLHGIALASWPLPRPSDWLAFVNDVEPGPDLDFIRVRTNKGKPIRPTEPDRAEVAISARESVSETEKNAG